MQTTNFWNLYYLSSKKIISTLVLFFVIGQVNAQYNIQKHDTKKANRKYSYGIHLGVSQHNFRGEKSNVFLQQNDFKAIEGRNNLGLEVGLIGALHPLEKLEVRAIPAIAFGNRDVAYYKEGEDGPEILKNETTFFDFAGQLKYKSDPYKDMRMFVIAGGKYRKNLSYKAAAENPTEDKLRLAQSDVMAEVGFGGEFHFPLFTLAPEFKVSQGFMNQRALDPNPYSQNLSALYSRLYSISINIE